MRKKFGILSTAALGVLFLAGAVIIIAQEVADKASLAPPVVAPAPAPLAVPVPADVTPITAVPEPAAVTTTPSSTTTLLTTSPTTTVRTTTTATATGMTTTTTGTAPVVVSVAAPVATVDTAAAGVPELVKEEPITMTVSDAKIQDVLRTLASMRPGVNIIMGPEVQGLVSFALKDVTWDYALQLVSESNGFHVQRDGENVYRITKPEAASKNNITIDLMTRSELAGTPPEELIKMVSVGRNGAEVKLDEARAEVLKAPSRFIRVLQVENRPAIEVVNALARKANLNFAFSADLNPAAAAGEPPSGAVALPIVLPPISVNLKYVSVVDALNLVAAQGGLSCVLQNGVWVVKPLPSQQLQEEPLKLETFEVKFLPLDDELVRIFQGVLSKRGKASRGKNKVLVVQDTSQGLEAVRRTLEAMDRATPQVLIEARFFELQKDSSKRLGIDWAVLGKEGISVNARNLVPFDYTNTINNDNKKVSTAGTNNSSTRTTTTQNGGTTRTVTTNGVTTTTADPGIFPGVTETTQTVTTLPGTISDTLANVVGSTGSSVATHTRDELSQTVRSAILDVSDFSVVLHALYEDTGAKQLSNPKIMVSSDQQATIHIGNQQPIVKSTTSSSNGSNTTTFELDPDYGGETTQEEQLTAGGETQTKTARVYTNRKGYLDLGTRLTVAPSVKTQDQVYIKVVPELTTLLRFEQYGLGATAVSYPVLYSTQVRTEFTIRSGQTIAIGGLVNDNEANSLSKIPLLGDIPYLGKWLFSYETKSKSQAETIIFLTVRVVDTKDMTASTGIPIRSYLVQGELERVQAEDASGGVYSLERAKENFRRSQLSDEDKQKEDATRADTDKKKTGAKDNAAVKTGTDKAAVKAE
jgi:type II secretory pathway component GspD/PulD (secretin)